MLYYLGVVVLSVLFAADIALLAVISALFVSATTLYIIGMTMVTTVTHYSAILYYVANVILYRNVVQNVVLLVAFVYTPNYYELILALHLASTTALLLQYSKNKN